jgi:hypothetical protein
MPKGRELFQFQRGGHRITVVVRGWPRVRRYIAYIDGEARVSARGKGDLKEIKPWRNPETGERGSKVVRMDKVPKTDGEIDLQLASTSLVERFNSSTRNFVSRYTRQTYKFSKRLSAHVHAMAIYAVYYNFTKEHSGLKKPEQHLTPAIKASLADRVWEFDEILDKVDEYWERQTQQQPVLQIVPPRPFVPLKPGETSSLPYFVMYSPNKREAKIHKGHCHNCRHGHGRKREPDANQWYAFATLQEARRCTQMLAPLDSSDYSICITGHYVRHYVRSKR